MIGATSAMPVRLSLALCATLSLALSACGDDDDDSGAPDAGAHDDDAGGQDAGDPSEPDSGTGEGDPLLIELDDGLVRGDMVGGSRRFLKVPYAKPPLGSLRFAAPQPPDPWSGERHETEITENCAQLEDQGSPASDNEDCLYLNIWAPADASIEGAPVMFWIHGGGNFSGGAGIPIPGVEDSLWYDGQFFAADQGVVLVTLNYRLGPLGFFAHPDLADEGEPLGNQGLLDQRMALQWLQDNIAHFGGDPDNVTIFGESAGSADVCYHMVSPGSRGLFHRAIGQSGGCTIRATGTEISASETGEQMVAYAEAVGCPADDDQLQCLREADIEDLLDNAQQPMPGAGEIRDADWSFAAVVDGDFLPDSPRALFDEGEIADVPYMLGANNDEGTTFVFRAESLTSEEEYMADLEERFGDAAEDVFAVYPPSDFDGDFDAARARAVGDSLVVCSTHDTARRAAEAGLDIYMYNFNVPWSILPTVLLAGHAAEISHVFGAPHLPDDDPDSEMVGREMNAYWASFAANGDPNHDDAPAQWPAFSVQDDQRLQLDADWEALEDFRSEECEFWRSYYE